MTKLLQLIIARMQHFLQIFNIPPLVAIIVNDKVKESTKISETFKISKQSN
jgi:hypothetical protein